MFKPHHDIGGQLFNQGPNVTFWVDSRSPGRNFYKLFNIYAAQCPKCKRFIKNKFESKSWREVYVGF